MILIDSSPAYFYLLVELVALNMLRGKTRLVAPNRPTTLSTRQAKSKENQQIKLSKGQRAQAKHWWKWYSFINNQELCLEYQKLPVAI